METEVEIRVPPELLEIAAAHRKAIAAALAVDESEIRQFYLIRRALDARRGSVLYVLRFKVYVGEVPPPPLPFRLDIKDVSKAAPTLIIGAGPAGLFAALRLMELGIKPVILEQGKPVRERRRDIAQITKHGVVNPQSNYCFGEGGAGTFSDGKLYTRSNKRGSIERVLRILVEHGATADILIDAHPHIGTNKLPGVVEAIRETITAHGGEVMFDARVRSLIRDASGISGVVLASGETLKARSVILAAGHSARELFYSLHAEHYLLERKPFALGVRVEHPQELIDRIQFRSPARPNYVPPASYSLVAQCEGRGVFSFCMCPGGIICPAATKDDEVVVNGWSPSKRNSKYANSGIVVEVRDEDLKPFEDEGALAGIYLQRSLEEKAYSLGGGRQVAPAQRLTDFLSRRVSQSLPPCSYLPGVSPCDLHELFPEAFSERLVSAFKQFGSRRKGYLTEDALVVGIESRTSSPVRIPRDSNSYMHPEAAGLFPVGEGAGYAGGIMSAAMDGENAAAAVAKYYAYSGNKPLAQP